MKYMSIILLICLLSFSMFTSRKINKNKLKTGSLPLDNIISQFLLGFVARIGGTVAIIEACLSAATDVVVAASAETASNGMVSTVGGETQTVFQKIAGYLEKVLDVCCAFKVMITSLIHYTTSRRRYRKKFIQGKSQKTTVLTRGFWSAIGDAFVVAGLAIADVAVVSGQGIATASVATYNGVVDVSVAIGVGVADAAVATAGFTVDVCQALGRSTLEIARDIVTGVQIAGQAVGTLAEWVGKPIDSLLVYAKEKIAAFFQPVMDLFNSIKQKILDYVLIPPIKTLLKFLACFKGLPAIALGIVSFTDGINLSISLITTPIGWAVVLVKLICQYTNLKEGIQLFSDAWKDANILTRYNKLGGASVSFLKAFADVR